MLAGISHWIMELVKKIDYLILCLGFPAYGAEPQHNEEKSYSRKEAAHLLNISVKTLRRRVLDGRLREDKNSLGIIYYQSAIDDFLKSSVPPRTRKS